MAIGLADILNGGLLSQGDEADAENALSQVTGAYDGIKPPTLVSPDLQNYNWLQDLNPEHVNQGADVQAPVLSAHTADAVNQAQSEMGNISTDPALRSQQMASLAALQNLAQSGGLNLQDKAALASVQDQAAQADRGRRQAIQQNMQARGMGGSGASLLAQLQSNQAATDQQSQQGMDIAGQAQQRALQAMMQGGQLAGQIQGQDFSQQAQQAQAQDAVNSFNARNQTASNQYNAGVQNQVAQTNAANALQSGEFNTNKNLDVAKTNAAADTNAQAYNNQGKQATANANVDTTNKQATTTAGLDQQNFQNQMAVAGAKSGAANAGLNYAQGKVKDDKDAWGNLIGGGAKILAAAHGGVVPGTPIVPGDSPLNDRVPATVSPGELIIPRTLAPLVVDLLKRLSGGTQAVASVPRTPDFGSFMAAVPGSKHSSKPEGMSPLLAALASLSARKDQ